MKHSFRALMVGILTLLLLACLSLFPAFAAENDAPGEPESAEATRAPAESRYVGTVRIVKTGYQNARKSPTDSTTIFRVHYGERFLCMADTGDGWYEILIPNMKTAYISSDPENAVLQEYEAGEVTLSSSSVRFWFETIKKADVYSQPKTTAKTRRVSADGSKETTYYYPKGSQLMGIGKTTRDGKDWFAFVSRDESGQEIAWVLAEDCEVRLGNTEAIIIPDWWYD